MVVADRIDATATQTVNELCAYGVEATKVLVDLTTFAGANFPCRATTSDSPSLMNSSWVTVWTMPNVTAIWRTFALCRENEQLYRVEIEYRVPSTE